MQLFCYIRFSHKSLAHIKRQPYTRSASPSATQPRDMLLLLKAHFKIIKTLERCSASVTLVLPCMYRRNIKLSQINICGMSNHSQIALNKFINITNPYVLCINETEKDMTSDKFDKYTWYQLSMETTAKVLPCLYIPAFLIYEYMISKIFILTAFGL